MATDYTNDDECLRALAKEKVGWPANTEDIGHSVDDKYLRVGHELDEHTQMV